jgi:Fe-S cluster assembly iron-binding protein IscA
MIKIERIYTITLLDSNVINYTITSNKSCITIDNASGSFNGTTKKIYVTYYVKDLDCFIGNLITVSISNDKDCTNSFTDTLVNECNNLEASIEQPNPNNLSFNAIVTGGKPPYLYNWIYGLEAQFTSNEPNTGFHPQKQLSLTWNHNPANILPPGYKNPQGIRVRVQDSNGCISEALNYYTLTCEPFIASQSIAAQCFPLTTGDIRKFVLSLTNSGCGNLDNNPLVISYAGVTQRSLGNNSYEITIPEFQTVTAVLPITVTNDKNVPSNIFNITVTKTGNCKIKPDCAAGFILNDYTSNTKTLQFDNSAVAITDFVDFATDYIDYDTFTFVASAGQVLTNPTTLTITNKGVATFNSATRLITYTQTTANESVIPIKWKVKNDCDIFSQEFTLNINSVLSIAPSVTNLTKTIFFGDTSTTTVTSNNSTTISSLKIITSPTVGTLTVNGSVVTYIPISYSSNNQTVTLQPINQYGKVGTSFTITYTILNSGIAVPLTVCTTTNPYSLFNLLQANSYTTGGTWTTTSALVITNNQVTVTNPGLYNFRYTVTNPTDSSTKYTDTSINYISLSISDIDVTYLTNTTRKIKITTVGFTEAQLQLITYVDVNVISPTGTLTITRNAIISRTSNILYTDIDITNTDGTVKTDYNFIEVIIPSELNDCSNPISRTYNKNPKLLESRLTASVSTTATITKVQEVVVSLASSLTASVTIPSSELYISVNRFNFDADYLMVQYKFTDGNDLDTRTRVVTPDIGQDTAIEYIGYGANYCSSNNYNNNGVYPAGTTFSGNNYILKHACDNTGTGFEAVLVNLNNFATAYPSSPELTIDCRGWWYSLVGTNNVKLILTLWKGGTIVSPTFNNNGLPTHFTFTNPTATNTLVIESSGKVVRPPSVSSLSAPNNNEAWRIGVIKYNISTNAGTINNVDTTTASINPASDNT